MQKYLVEFIGTFFLTLTVILTANNPGIVPAAPLAAGVLYMAMIYAGAQLSGAHYNPAVTLAVMMRGKLSTNDTGMYILAQVLAGVIATTIGVYLHGCGGDPAIPLHSNHEPVGSMIAEFMGAFAVVYVTLHVGTGQSDNIGNTYYGLAIGSVYIAAAYAFGGISGGAFNPAVALGGAVAGMYAGGDLWIYLVGALAGGAAAATVVALVARNEE